jgi:uncharacterized repeat protein (TIGR01451 family)
MANTATATATGEQAPLDNTATATDPIVRQANISLVKTTESDTVAAGGNVVYNVAITNAGPSAATSAELTDLLPTGVTFDPDLSDATCTVAVAGDPVSCDLTTVAVGATVTVRIGGRLDPAYTGATLENTASFDSDANDPIDSNTLSTPVEVLADLAVTKTATGDAVAAGGQVEYTITVANDGPSTATSVSLDDPIPAGTTLASVVPTAPLACTTVPCAVGSLGPGETASVVLTLNVPADRTPGPLDNTATADSPTPDPNPGRRTATATVEVIRNADVSVQKVLRTDPVVAGQPVSYDLVVTNAGPSNAEDVTVTDAIPLGTTLLAGDLGGPACEQTDIDAVPTVSCVLPQLAVGATFTGTLTLATDASLTGSLSNTAVVGSQALDRNDAGNVSTAVGLVVQAVDPTVPPTDPPSEPTTVPPPVTPPAPPTTTPTTVPPPPDSLPATGIAIGGLVVAGGVLLLGGGLLRDTATGRRRRLRVRR